MKEQEFKALISLLDDEDPEVESHVRAKLISLGDAVIPRLEAIWEQDPGELLQNRIENIIHLIQSQAVLNSLQDWKSDGGQSLLWGWFLVSQYQYPDLEYGNFKNEVSRLVNRIWLELRAGMNVVEQLKVVNRMLFSKERYRGNSRNLNEPSNYFLNGMIETKKGAPISLGMLYLVVCQELDIPVQGLILPDYFVLTYREGKHEFYIDVFNKGAFFVRRDLTRYLKEVKKEGDESYYVPRSHLSLVTELVRSLRESYRHRKQDEKVREFELLIDHLEEES